MITYTDKTIHLLLPNITRSAMIAAVRSGKLKGRKCGRRWYFLGGDVESFIRGEDVVAQHKAAIKALSDGMLTSNPASAEVVESAMNLLLIPAVSASFGGEVVNRFNSAIAFHGGDTLFSCNDPGNDGSLRTVVMRVNSSQQYAFEWAENFALCIRSSIGQSIVLRNSELQRTGAKNNEKTRLASNQQRRNSDEGCQIDYCWQTSTTTLSSGVLIGIAHIPSGIFRSRPTTPRNPGGRFRPHSRADVLCRVAYLAGNGSRMEVK